MAKVANAQEKREQGKIGNAVRSRPTSASPLIDTGKVDGGEAIIAAVDKTIACLQADTTAGQTS